MQQLTLTRTSIPCTSAAFAELASEVLRAGKALRFEARGGSMQPLIRDGDVLLVEPVAASAVKVGDMVLCTAGPGRVLVHRVIRVRTTGDGRRFTMQGDALPHPDGEIAEAQVYGRAVGIERGATRFDLRRPLMRALAWAAAQRSRWDFGRGDRLRPIRRWLKRLPMLRRVLA
jgi:signal peptidase I